MDKKYKTIFSSKSDEWETPKHIYDELNTEFNFTLDPCATKENHKCDMYYTKDTNGLEKNWGGNVCFATHHTPKLVHG